jgi:hypothetical protein
MSETIAKYRPEMQVELHGVKEHEVGSHLLSLGYRLWQIEDDVEITPDRLECLHGHLFVY